MSQTKGATQEQGCQPDQPQDIVFEQLVRQYSASLFHFIYRFLGEYDAANDVCQHVFIQLYTFLPTLRTDRSLLPWLFHVARNRCLDEMRRKRSVRFSELEAENGRQGEDEESPLLHLLPDTHPLPDEVTEHHELQYLLWEAIRALPPKLRAVVALRYGNALSYAEIGALLHIPQATAKTYFQRAKPLLRAFLTSRGVTTAA